MQSLVLFIQHRDFQVWPHILALPLLFDSTSPAPEPICALDLEA